MFQNNRNTITHIFNEGNPLEQNKFNMNPQYNCVVNLSNFILNETHISLLQKGVKCFPTPPVPNPGQMRLDFDRYHTRLHQISFFNKQDSNFDLSSTLTNITPPPPLNPMGTSIPFKHLNFKSKSRWQCPPGPPNLEAMIVCNELHYNNRPPYRPTFQDNLSPKERSALKKLCNNKDIIIKPADKGSAVVVMQREDYLKEGYKQLSDTKFYTKLDNEPTADFHKKIKYFFEDMY